MSAFTINDPAGKEFQFELDGSVMSAAGASTWATGSGNSIVLGTGEKFAVTWSFNDKNQLIVSAGGTPLLNFNKVKGNRPFFELNNAVLRCRPDKNHAFTFELRGDWNIDSTTSNLEFTPNGSSLSVLKGAFQDPRGRCMYLFTDQENPAVFSFLGFVGSWSHSVDQSGTPRL